MRKKKVVAIIQARTTSKRFPRKILSKINGKTVLQHVIDRVKKASFVDEVIVASPHYIPFHGAKSYIHNGDENNVLDRYYHCARFNSADIIVRITSDCPLIEPHEIDYAICYFKSHIFPFIGLSPIDGFDVEVFSFDMLTQAWENAKDKFDREHVTPYMRRKTKLSVDTIENLEKVRRIINGLEQ